MTQEEQPESEAEEFDEYLKAPGDEDQSGAVPSGGDTCPACAGSGILDEETCSECGGTGTVGVGADA